MPQRGILVLPVSMPGGLNPIGGGGRADRPADDDGLPVLEMRQCRGQPVRRGFAVCINEGDPLAVCFADAAVTADGNAGLRQFDNAVESELAGRCSRAIGAAAIDEQGLQVAACRSLQGAD